MSLADGMAWEQENGAKPAPLLPPPHVFRERRSAGARDPVVVDGPDRGPHGWMQTFTGVKFYPLKARAHEVVLEDIAHALSHLCRFAGHVRHFYSVAEHSVRVSWVCPPGLELEGLLHDATEAYMVDLPSPIKRTSELRGYREAEQQLRGPIAERFGLMQYEPFDVQIADRVLLETEMRDLYALPLRHHHAGAHLNPLPAKIWPWPAWEARVNFLARFAELMLEEPSAALGRCRACNGPTRVGGQPLVRGLWGEVCSGCGGDYRYAERIGRMTRP